MSVASSIPSLKLPNPSTSCSSSSSSIVSSSSNSCFSYRFSRTTNPYAFTICCSQTEGPIRRPMAPSPPSVMKPVPPSPPQQQQPPKQKPASGVAIVEDKNGVTLEFQRLKAKELQDYFKQKKFEEANKAAPFFGFLPKNEISNGRWAMFGFAVGMLTEYATGSDFVDQVKILLSNFGILDLE
ncbi:hypothetical protein LWI28_015367 [Acer negundo]|uniref:Uncharacterized protein n=1 Tax=Acer negundo TaxID=4023 RepID=A0AAD5JTU4_ACENE|nr:hypothetical protein LWI28_015367 [Acer negundo]KAK4859556.1 hypothetical protein QYF36_007541 [Acer negundo]